MSSGYYSTQCKEMHKENKIPENEFLIPRRGGRVDIIAH